MKYNGKELKEVITPQVFDQPKEMLTWNCEYPIKRLIVAIIPGGIAIDVNKYWLSHCAWIPEETKSRRATNRELAKWIPQYGEWTYEYDDAKTVYHEFSYKEPDREKLVVEKIYIRKWEDTEWHEPTVDYMGIE